MTCIKMGSDESRFNVSLVVRDKVTRPCPQTTTFEEKGEPKPKRRKESRSGIKPRSFRLPAAYRFTARPNRLSELLIMSPGASFINRALMSVTHRLVQRHQFSSQLRAQGHLRHRERLVSGGISVRIRFGSPFSSKVVVCGHCLVTLSLTIMKH